MIDLLITEKWNEPLGVIMLREGGGFLSNSGDAFNFTRSNTKNKKLGKMEEHPPHPLGRHPFNILTEEIYD